MGVSRRLEGFSNLAFLAIAKPGREPLDLIVVDMAGRHGGH